MKPEHKQAQAWIRAYYDEQIEARDLEQMRAHLRDCDACRAHYDALADGEQKTLGAGASVLAEQRILGAVLAGSALADPEPSSPKRLGWLPWCAPAALGLVALLLYVGVGDHKVPGLASKGATSGQVSVCGIGVAGVSSDTGVVYDARRPEGVSLSDRLRFSYRCERQDARYLFLCGLDKDLNIYWYFPMPDEGQSLSIRERGREATLPYETELRARHHHGALAIVALFSPSPLSVAEVRARVGRAKAQGRSLDDIVWPKGVLLQRVDVLLRKATP